MSVRLLGLWHRLRASLWALPLATMLVAAGLAVLALNFTIDGLGDDTWWLYNGSAKEAPDFLATLLGSMITMGTLSLSLTMVVLTLAAQQLGPRLIHYVMSSRRTQSAVGLFLATVVYLLLVLRAVYGQATDAEVPNLAVTVGTALVLASVIALLLFTHHLARSIVADAVIHGVGTSLDAVAEQLLPSRRDGSEKPTAAEIGRLPAEGAPIRLRDGGYIRAVDHARLVEAAAAESCVVVLTYRPGHHVLPGAVHARVAPAAALTPALEDAVAGAVLLGGERTPDQDIEFPIRQLVEVALRALSPGINDTFTAVAAIDRLALSLARIMRRGPAQREWRDAAGVVRLVLPASTFEGMLDAAFDAIRQASRELPAVLIHLAETLGQLASIAEGDQRGPVAAHLGRIAATGRTEIRDEHDAAAFESRLRWAQAQVDRRERGEARAFAPDACGANIRPALPEGERP